MFSAIKLAEEDTTVISICIGYLKVFKSTMDWLVRWKHRTKNAKSFVIEVRLDLFSVIQTQEEA